MHISQGGCPAKLSDVDQQAIIWSITTGRVDTAVQAARDFQDDSIVSVSAQTIRRALKDAGLRAGPKAKKPKLQSHRIQQRLEFALEHQNWTVDDWKQVVWPD